MPHFTISQCCTGQQAQLAEPITHSTQQTSLTNGARSSNQLWRAHAPPPPPSECLIRLDAAVQDTTTVPFIAWLQRHTLGPEESILMEGSHWAPGRQRSAGFCCCASCLPLFWGVCVSTSKRPPCEMVPLQHHGTDEQQDLFDVARPCRCSGTACGWLVV